MSGKIRCHRDLDIYKRAFGTAMEVFELSKAFPKEETYSLTDQIRRSSRSVSANVAEAGRKRRYEAAFISKMNDAETEAAETQVWLEFAVSCGYLPPDIGQELHEAYDRMIATLVSMIAHSAQWVLPYSHARGIQSES